MNNQEEYNKLIKIDHDFTTSHQEYNDEKKTTITIDDSININDTNTQPNLNIKDYSIPDDELDFMSHVDILNIYNIYYKTLYNKNNNATLFDEIDLNEITSTNRSLENLFEEIHKFKISDQRFTTLYDPTIYKNTFLKNSSLPADYPFYIIKTEDEEKVTHNLITGINFIASKDWKNIKWSINQINEF